MSSAMRCDLTRRLPGCDDAPWRSNCWKQRPRAQRSQYHMIVHVSDARSVFGDNSQRLAFLLRTNNAPKMDHTVRDDDVRLVQKRSPLLLAQFSKQALADRSVCVLVGCAGGAARQYP